MLKLLFAHDGSECSDKALQDLQKAGLPDNVEAVVLTAADVWNDLKSVADYSGLNPTYVFLAGGNDIQSAEILRQEAEVTARAAAERLKKLFPRWTVAPDSICESPTRAIIHKTQIWKPDLVVVGSHGRSAVGRFILGSVSQHMIYHLHENLRIARTGPADVRAPLRIMVAFDGSQESETAFETALHRNWPYGTEMKLVSVVDTRLSTAFIFPTSPIRYWMRSEDKDPIAWVYRMQEDQKKRIESKGYIASSAVLKGDPKQGLLKEAETWGSDCIFVGSRGLGARERFLVGSVSSALAMRAHCSVEIVHEVPYLHRSTLSKEAR